MSREQFTRTERLLGADAMERLAASRVAVFGVGGVGGYAVEALARSGVGTLDLIDNDKVCESNLNRQIIALHSTLGQYKVDAAAQRARDINPDITVNAHKLFYTPETAGELDFRSYDYIIDAIDTVTGKLDLAVKAQEYQIPVISSMGAGNKLDPGRFVVTDLAKTTMDPLARIMRKELKKRGIRHLKVVYSTEKPMPVEPVETEASLRRTTPGSTACWVPAAAGLMLAGEVIRDLTGVTNPEN